MQVLRRRLKNLAPKQRGRLLISSSLLNLCIICSKDYEANHEKMLNLIVETVLNVNPHIPEKKKKRHH